ncbi:hypothetical protein RP20_CCG006371 [Aedes albopictus]|nr:hypothetical protein RP20_CCG006371 [Aedes albopictus]
MHSVGGEPEPVGGDRYSSEVDLRIVLEKDMTVVFEEKHRRSGLCGVRPADRHTTYPSSIKSAR